MSEVTDALDALARGDQTVNQVRILFREREWPRHGDADGPPQGSFAEVVAAFKAGVITQEEYTTLAEAASQAMNEQQADPGDVLSGTPVPPPQPGPPPGQDRTSTEETP
jgi:hypothetical protein